MGENDVSSWDDRKQRRNIEAHGFDFADLKEVFDGRFCLVRRDERQEYGERRYNMLVDYRDRIINVTFTPRADKARLISVRPASRSEREVYHAKKP